MARVDVRVSVPDVPDDVVADAAARFIADGTVGVIEGWLSSPTPKVDDFMRVYVSLLPAWWPKDLTVATP
jgi:hypothetical protein